MPNRFTIEDCKMVALNRINNRSGNITVVQNDVDIPFSVRRVYYLYDVPGGESRGAHGHRTLQQMIIAVSGSFEVTIDDGCSKKSFVLNRPFFGLRVPPGMWRDISNFSSGAICLVLASGYYDEGDYLRSYDDFLSFRGIPK
jgi:hypothetical protein